MAKISKINAAFIETQVDDEVVIVSLEEGHFFSLKDTGLAIWRLIDGERDRDAILSALQGEFDAPAGVLAADLDTFLADIASVGFVAQA